MKKVSLCFLVAAVMITACQNHNVLTEAERAAGWELLFDGKTLNGWRDYGRAEVNGPWVVENGTLSALGQGCDLTGYIITDRQFENFDLVFDWKISPGGNSGVFYHVVERPEYTVPYATGPEYQVVDCAGFPNEGWPYPLEDWMKVGVNYAMHVPDPALVRPMPVGRWNTSRILFDNGHVEHWLNGIKILEFQAWSDDWFERKNSGKWDDFPEYGLARRGHISLQDHGDRVWYRNMKIRELPRKTGHTVELFNGVDLHGWEIYGAEMWHVEDGVLVGENSTTATNGFLVTRKYYDDFDLTVDFKLESGNSGVFYRSWIPVGVNISGWQAEIFGRNTAGVYEARRGMIKVPAPENVDVKNVGDWNTMRVLVKGDHVTTWLNGTQMVELQDEEMGIAQGRIALQIWGPDVRVLFKNLKLTQL